MAEETRPLGWLETVDESLRRLDEKPQWGSVALFPKERVEERLRVLFQRKELTLSIKERGWTLPGDPLEELGIDVEVATVALPPLRAPAFFAYSRVDLKVLMGTLLGSEEGAAFFFDATLLEGFSRYLSCEILAQMEGSSFISGLSPRLALTPHHVRERFSKESQFAIEVSCTLNSHQVSGLLLLSPAFRTEWKAHFSQMPKQWVLDPEKEQLPLRVAVEMGGAQLFLEEWKRVRVGDFLLLDEGSFDPETREGSLLLTLAGSPLFRGRWTPEGLQISDYPHFQERRGAMDEEEGFEADEDEEFEEEDEFKEESEEFETDEEDSQDEEVEEERKAFEMETAPLGPLAPEKIPLQLTVELCRIQMTLQDLLKLAPGNLLELGILPEQGVDLVVNGKRAGRGELIKMGEVLGVRILNL